MKPKIQSPFTARLRPGKSGAEHRLAASLTGATALTSAGDQSRPQTGAPGRAGYSLIEFVGVLAILAILAAMIIPMVVNEEEIAAVNAETSNLNTFNSAFVSAVIHTAQIPGATNWASTVANWMMLPTASVTTNSKGYVRVYVYDTNGFGSVTLPYVQSTGLATLPANPRLMIISSLSANPPDASGGVSSNEFAAIWNTAPGSIPGTWTGWTGHGNDLMIQRVNLVPLFHRLVLSPIDTNDFGSVVIQSSTNASPYVTVLTNFLSKAWTLTGTVVSNLTGSTFQDAGSSSPAPTIPGVNAWFLQGTVIGLFDTNNSPVSPNLEASLMVMQSDISYVFEDRYWRGLLTGWGTNGPAGLNTIVGTVGTAAAAAVAAAYITTSKTFTACPINTRDSGGASRGDTCQALQGGCNTFIMDYNNWSKEGFGIGSDNACIRLLNDDANSIYNLTQNMCQ